MLEWDDYYCRDAKFVDTERLPQKMRQCLLCRKSIMTTSTSKAFLCWSCDVKYIQTNCAACNKKVDQLRYNQHIKLYTCLYCVESRTIPANIDRLIEEQNELFS